MQSMHKRPIIICPMLTQIVTTVITKHKAPRISKQMGATVASMGQDLVTKTVSQAMCLAISTIISHQVLMS